MARLHIAVLYSLPSKRAAKTPYVETDTDTMDSAREVGAALEGKGADVTLYPIDEDHIDDIRRIRTDLFFNVIEWTGLDLLLADRALAAIERTGIPCTGATRWNYLVTSDKISMKKEFDRYGLPTARWQVVSVPDEAIRKDFQYPVIVKPSLEHCSIGLSKDSIISDEASLRRKLARMVRDLHEPMLVEEFLDGREFQVTAIEGPLGLRVLPPAEVVYDTASRRNLLTYNSRWEEQDPEYKTSHMKITQIEQPLLHSMEHITRQTFTKLKFRDYTRLDVRTRGEEVYILEANSNPGLSDSDEYGMTLSYKAVGWTFADFIWEIVASAKRRAVIHLSPA